jgi:maltooligosyltrehalose trehalohydrolase
VFDPSFPWSDEGFRAPPLAEAVIYELHVGTYTAAGTFGALHAHLDELAALGVDCLELMPIAAFPGGRNWGYDGVQPFAVQETYGGPRELQRLVDACHARGIAVVVDVVYNHLGPEGNYTGELAPYHTARYATPWGKAMNFDDAGSDHVRRWFIASALWLLEGMHVDGLRIDAVHAIFDASARSFLAELTAAVQARASALGRRPWLIAESDLNDARVLRPDSLGGHGMDAQWADDFHHVLHVLATGERAGYYGDFAGTIAELAVVLREGWLYSGQFSQRRGRRHGNSARELAGERFVVCTQNHDQIGNRAQGDRLAATLALPLQRLLAGVLLTAPFVPLLFMGQEWGATEPFPYFTSHGDQELARAVSAGRRAEFAAFGWDPKAIPDPQAETTFAAARLDHAAKSRSPHREILTLHRQLLRLRREHASLQPSDRPWRESGASVEERPDERALLLRRERDGDATIVAFNFGARLALTIAAPGQWRVALDSEEARFGGAKSGGATEFTGSVRVELLPHSFAILARVREGSA